MSSNATSPARWYSGVTGYQWLVLVIASAGWVFDAFEGQIFNLTRNDLLAELLKVAGSDPQVKQWGDIFLGVFLAGGTFGGLLFGSLADRWGRRPTMAVTILFYSVFSGLTFFATNLWQVAVLRFLVAMGVGGEWAVAAALVAEVFPQHARAHASGIFHATSVLGTWLAALAGLAVGANWRWAYLIGVGPALLTLWVRASVKEPESWAKAATENKRMGSFADLLGNPRWRGRALLGMLLAAVGLGTFWGVTVAGQDLTKELLLRTGAPAAEAASKAKFAYGIVQSAGGGLGLLAFGPIAVRFGRRRTFALMLVLAFLIVPVACYVPQTYAQMLVVLPVFGFLTLSIHAGFAVYFPELFPNHLRATGSGFCFNGGRLLAASMLFFSGWLKALPGMKLQLAITLLGGLFLCGLIVLNFLPETKDQPLPE
ncbi:MAG: MFS transporter [Verrucomicrobia bacterium]|nr:MFS transporter [Verrucomicrobiota bacterium]